MTKYMSICQCN